MSDIVERVRARAANFDRLMGNLYYYSAPDATLDREAAADIERLRGTVDRAREAAHRGLKEWVGVQSPQNLINALINVIAELDALSGKGEL
jgi:hypothetical protein